MTEIREAMHELTTRPAPIGLADRALTGAARQRRRGRLLGAVGTAALAAAVGTAVALNAVATGSPSPRPAPGRYAVLSYEQHTDDPADPWYAWDPETHRYVKTGQSILPSPDGTWGLVLSTKLVEASAAKPVHQVAIARWADAVHGRHLRTYNVTGMATWSADGTIVAVDSQRRTTTTIDPATGATRSVPWPAVLRLPDEGVIGSGGITAGRIVYWSVNKQQPSTVTVRVTDWAGKVLETTRIPVASRPGFPIVNIPGYGPGTVARTPTVISRDGTHLAQPGLVVDTGSKRAWPDPSVAGPLVGWYGNDLLLGASPGENHKPITLQAVDANGHVVHRVSLATLPGDDSGEGWTRAYVATVGPDTEGAVTI